MKNRILLVGGAGFIGHHLAKKMNEFGNEVFVLDSFEVNNMLAHLGNDLYTKFIIDRYNSLLETTTKIYKVDARDYHKVSNAVDDCKPNIIIHLAAVAHANKSNKDPYTTYDHSLRTLENALDAARSAQVEQFIYFSSSMVYGDFKEKTVTENSELKPKGIYGALKLCGEIIVKSYNQVFDLPYTIIRPCALYGPRCVSRRVIQIFIENLQQNKPIFVEGDGTDFIDFTYIDDLVDGVILCTKSHWALNDSFNLTAGKARSINELIDILKQFYPDMKVQYLERDKLIPERGTLSTKHAEEMLEYKPKYDLETGVAEYVNWYRNNRWFANR